MGVVFCEFAFSTTTVAKFSRCKLAMTVLSGPWGTVARGKLFVDMLSDKAKIEIGYLLLMFKIPYRYTFKPSLVRAGAECFWD